LVAALSVIGGVHLFATLAERRSLRESYPKSNYSQIEEGLWLYPLGTAAGCGGRPERWRDQRSLHCGSPSLGAHPGPGTRPGPGLAALASGVHRPAAEGRPARLCPLPGRDQSQRDGRGGVSDVARSVDARRGLGGDREQAAAHQAVQGLSAVLVAVAEVAAIS